MERPLILIGEGNEACRRELKGFLFSHRFAIAEAADINGILQTIHSKKIDLLVLGPSLNEPGLKLTKEIRKTQNSLPLILLAAQGSEDFAVAALRSGINDYIKPPFNSTELITSINRCLAESFTYASNISSEACSLADQLLVSESRAMREIKKYIEKVASTESNVLITGETGTGKERVAELIYRKSQRYEKPFVCFNCAAIPDSLFESELFGYEKGAFTGAHTSMEGKLQLADGGTVFFDEIGEMSPAAQAKMLRAIECKEMQRLGGKKTILLNVRFIAATNQDLERLVSQNLYRRDLYYRLNVARIDLPPLRDRKEDLLLLIDHYIRVLNQQFNQEIEGFTDEAFQCLLAYEWPGNVRELKNLLEAIFISQPSRRISPADFPKAFQECLSKSTGCTENERDRLVSALLSTNWNKSKAAEKLHWSRMTLYRKIEKYGVQTAGS